ncbi:Spo0B domain-containing protein [Solibacillus silvestris]|uniref:Spo0B domain-containing protein n=1 Tax=Solibacillus silvestris TaxID=76853 RepID=UPI003F818F4B
MTVSKLTVNEVLRYANHDYLNQLHLIQMNLDLGRVDDAKKVIFEQSEHCKMLSNINRLQITETVEWLHTVHWRYPAFQLHMTSDVSAPIQGKYDEAIVQYLENTIIHVYGTLDPYEEHQLQLNIEAHENKWNISFHLTGKWEQTPYSIEQNIFNVDTYEQTNTSWKYVIHMHEE